MLYGSSEARVILLITEGCEAEAVFTPIIFFIHHVTEGCHTEASPPPILSMVALYGRHPDPLKQGRPTDMAATIVIVKESNLLLRPVAGKDLLPLIDRLVGPDINGMRCA
jgi:hypothetical protein